MSLYSNLLASFLFLVDGFLLKTIPIAFHGHVQREEGSLNEDLPSIPLAVIQQSTNYFSESSKLGEGGFGPVYKVLVHETNSDKIWVFF